VSREITKADPTGRTMDHWAVGKPIEWAAGKDGNEKTKAKLRDELCGVADELAGPSPSPVERVLAETAASAWFAYRMHEATYAARVTSEGGMSLAQSEHAQRRMDRAHRRFLSTLKALAAVRRLAVPALQINLAHRQQIAQLNARGSESSGPTAERSCSPFGPGSTKTKGTPAALAEHVINWAMADRRGRIGLTGSWPLQAAFALRRRRA
jgi:hypothetical protein